MAGGIGKGNTCKPMAVSFQCMTKFTTNKKKKKTSILSRASLCKSSNIKLHLGVMTIAMAAQLVNTLKTTKLYNLNG